MKIAALYIRVSTDDQLEFSPEAQKKALIDYAKKNEYQVDERYIFIEEGKSGTTAKYRPSFMKMIATAKSKPKPFDAILVHKFDRFARSREDSVVYKSLLRRECGIKVISITEQMEDDKFSVILEAMLEAMAEYYSLNLSDEVMKGMTEKAQQGQVQSVAPFGYRIKDKHFVICEEEAKIVKTVFNKYVNEGLHCSNISRYLNSLGIKTIRDNKWDARGIKRMLRNNAYIGSTTWNKTGRDKNYKYWTKDESEWIVVENTHEAIVDKELFDKANSMLDYNASLKTSKRPANYEIKHYLSGLIRCSDCGGTLIYSITGNDRSNYFQCGAYRRGKCNTSNSIVAYKAEEMFIKLLEEYIPLLQESDFTKFEITKRKQENTSEKEILKKRLLEIKNKYDAAKRAYLAGIDSLEEYADNKKLIKNEEIEIQKYLDDNSDSDTSNAQVIQGIESFLGMLKSGATPKKLNDTLKSFVDCAIFNKAEDSFKIKIIL
ncbi:MAG: recombinase family protein [Cellulosilyticum sp.]|nr:recombinase family protein [Cellulosilyticum sp.]